MMELFFKTGVESLTIDIQTLYVIDQKDGLGLEFSKLVSMFWWDRPANNYFKWFHVFEDELSHRGQIRIIKKMMNKVKK
ncbi:hypothetical protein [Bacillus salipaludis]|uniref:Uncharacterized protein n=1 Tax=Bacillus salipaludis TaxID=2547811 RepID=A0ABW8RPB0_9BACI